MRTQAIVSSKCALERKVYVNNVIKMEKKRK